MIPAARLSEWGPAGANDRANPARAGERMKMKIGDLELLQKARIGRPEVHYRLDRSRGSIAAEVGGEWHRVACKTIQGEWFEMGDLLVNGERIPFEPDLAV